MSLLDRWRTLSPLLEEVLDLPARDRSAWLAALRERDPECARDIAALLEEHDALDGDNFLRIRPPAPSHGDAPAAGDTLGAYTLISTIGRGGMGTVWLARRSDGRFDRPAAVKFLNTALSSGAQARFRREGAILARLTHPNVAQLLDAGVTGDGRPYLVLEYVDGQPIDLYCEAHDLDAGARVRLLLDVIDAVAYAHASLVVHRDVKPSNVLVRSDGAVKLLDFGIAKLIEDDAGGATELTRDGAAAMTPEYAAPEQVSGDPITAATDVYALGVLAYVILTGAHPTNAAARTPASVVKAILDVEPRHASVAAPRDRAAVLRGDLDTILSKALKKAPGERYPTAAAMADDVRRYLNHQPVHARPDTLGYRAFKFMRRNRTAVALASLAGIAAAAGVAGTLIQSANAREQRDYAFRQLARAEAVNELNNFVLYDAATGGRSFTIPELLADADRIVRRQRGDDLNRVWMLVSIGRQYSTNDEDAKARAILEEAYRDSRPLADPSVQARAACALGSALSRGEGGQTRADALYDEAMRDLPQGQRFVLDRIFCLQRGSEISREAGRAREGVERAAEAERLVAESPFRSPAFELQSLTGLAEALRMNNQLREAATVFEKAAAEETALGRDQTQNHGTLLNNWGMALYSLGRIRESEAVFARAVAISRGEGGDDAVSPMLLVNYARVLGNLAEGRRAAEYAERGYSKALASGDDIVVNQSLLVRAGIYRQLGEFPKAAQMYDEVEPRLRRHLPPTHFAFLSLAAERALLAQAVGDLPRADALIEPVIAALERTVRGGGTGGEFLPVALIRRASIRLDLGRAHEAIDDANEAVKLITPTIEPGRHSAMLGRAEAMLARAQEAAHNPVAATRAARTAAEHLADTLGPDNSETLAARRLADQGGH